MPHQCRWARFFSLPLSPSSSSSSSSQTSRRTPFHFLSHLLDQCSTLDHIIQAHTFILSRGLDQDDFLLSKFIQLCSSLGFKDYAFSLFKFKQSPDLHLFNTIIRTLSQSDSPRDAIALFNKIQVAGFRPDTHSFPPALKAAAHLSALKLGSAVHGQVLRFGFQSDIHVSTGLVHMYSACRSIYGARQLFDEIPLKDLVLWNAMVGGYAKAGDPDSARKLFEKMPERNVVSWTSVIAGYAQTNRAGEAISMFRRMQLEDNIRPDEVALLSALSACSQLGALDFGEWIHAFIDRHHLRETVPLKNALIDMYAKAGNIWKAFDVFRSMGESKNVVTWTTMMAGFALHGLGREALCLFHRSEIEGAKPNSITFIAVLSACSHIGDVHLGKKFFGCMKSLYNVEHQIEHYGCMVDILGRAGLLREARDMVSGMPFQPNAAIWGSLLSASRMCGDVEVGEEALSHLIEVEPQNRGNYSIMSDLYAAYGRWNEVRKLRKATKEWGVDKVPGGSCIELDGRVHEFTARDGFHPSFEKIYEVLDEINDQLKFSGYVPKVSEAILEDEVFAL